MPQRKLAVAAILSLVVLSILLAGNFARFGPELAWPTRTGKPVRRAIAIYLEEGRLAVWWEAYDSDFARLPKTNARSLRWSARPAWPSLDRMLWSFDLHSLDGYSFSPVGMHRFLVAFPLWCLELPCLAAPLLWWAKRKRVELAGFAVIVPAGSDLE